VVPRSLRLLPHRGDRCRRALAHGTGTMLWGGAAYNNGILPFKNYITGEPIPATGSRR
jgi:hypothetical protein